MNLVWVVPAHGFEMGMAGALRALRLPLFNEDLEAGATHDDHTDRSGHDMLSEKGRGISYRMLALQHYLMPARKRCDGVQGVRQSSDWEESAALSM